MSLVLLPIVLKPLVKRTSTTTCVQFINKGGKPAIYMDVNHPRQICNTLHIVHATPNDLMRLANGNRSRYGHSPGTPTADLLV